MLLEYQRLEDDCSPRVKRLSGPVSYTRLHSFTKGSLPTLILIGDIHESLKQGCERCGWCDCILDSLRSLSLRSYRCPGCYHLTDIEWLRHFPQGKTTFFIEDKLKKNSIVDRICDWWEEITSTRLGALRLFNIKYRKWYASPSEPEANRGTTLEPNATRERPVTFIPVDIRAYDGDDPYFFEPMLTIFLYVITDQIHYIYDTTKPSGMWLEWFFSMFRKICNRNNLSVLKALREWEETVIKILTQDPHQYYLAIYHNRYFMSYSHLHNELAQLCTVNEETSTDVVMFQNYLYEHIEYMFTSSIDDFREVWKEHSLCGARNTFENQKQTENSHNTLLYYKYLSEGVRQLFKQVTDRLTTDPRAYLSFPKDFKLIDNRVLQYTPFRIDTCLLIDHYTILKWMNHADTSPLVTVMLMGEFHVSSIHHFMVNITKWYEPVQVIRNNQPTQRLRCIDFD